MSGLTQKQIIDLNRIEYDAVYFLNGKRILTYSSINKMTALEQQMIYQRMHAKPITMILLPEGKMPYLKLTRDIEDYHKYLE